MSVVEEKFWFNHEFWDLKELQQKAKEIAFVSFGPIEF